MMCLSFRYLDGFSYGFILPHAEEDSLISWMFGIEIPRNGTLNGSMVFGEEAWWRTTQTGLYAF